MQNSSSSFQPDWASPPGETINELIEQRGLSCREFADQIDHSDSDLRNLLQGRTRINIRLARQLHSTLGGSVEFWMTRELQYRMDLKRISDEEGAWLESLPLADMVRLGWVYRRPTVESQVQECLRFFEAPSVRVWQHRYLAEPALVALRTSPTYESRPESVVTWVRQAMRVGHSVDSAAWSPSGLRASLDSMRALSRRKHPRDFLPALRRHCASFGVALVVLRAPDGCRASGAATFLSSEKALVVVSFRYLTDDHFWFTFFHELGHLLLHGGDRLFIDEGEAPSNSEEDEANAFAANALIPPKYQEELASLPAQAREVIRFARKMGLAPGVVVGQMQHRRMISFRQLNGLKRRYAWRDGSDPTLETT